MLDRMVFWPCLIHEVYACFFLPFLAPVLSVCYVARHYWASWDGVIFSFFLFFVSSLRSLISVQVWNLDSGDDIRFQLGILVSCW